MTEILLIVLIVLGVTSILVSLFKKGDSGSGKITNRQADKLFDLGLYENPEVQKLINDCQDYW